MAQQGMVDMQAAKIIVARLMEIYEVLETAEDILAVFYADLTDQILANELTEEDRTQRALEAFYEFQRKVDGGYITPADPEYQEFVDCGWMPSDASPEEEAPCTSKSKKTRSTRTTSKRFENLSIG